MKLKEKLFMAFCIVVVLAGCTGAGTVPTEDSDEPVVERYEVVEVDGQEYVCFEHNDTGNADDQMECVPHGDTDAS